MPEVVILFVFFVLLIVGSGNAALIGRLPTAKQLQEEDEIRFARYRRALDH